MLSDWNSYTLLDGTTYKEKDLEISYKVKHIVCDDPAILLLGIYTEKKKM